MNLIDKVKQRFTKWMNDTSNKEDFIVIEISDEEREKREAARKAYEEAIKARDAEYREWRNEKGKLIGIQTKYGLERVADDYEVNQKLDKLEKKIDKLNADIKKLSQNE